MGDETKECPFCSEQIAASAKKCRFCNEWIDGKAELSSKLAWQGSRLVLPVGATLPSGTCWICGNDGPQMGRKQKKYTYTPPWVYFGLLGGLIPVVVLAMIFQKTASLAIPLCGPCKQRWLMSEIVFGVFGFVGFFGLPAAGAFIGNAVAGDNGLGLGILFGFLAWIGGMIALNFALCVRAQIKSTFIDSAAVTLQMPNPSAVKRAFKDRTES